jgi:hypothetical protein
MMMTMMMMMMMMQAFWNYSKATENYVVDLRA